MTTQTTTTTTATPQRIAADYYQISSLSKARAGILYNLRFNYESKRWTCDCYDAVSSGNPACKHVRRLRAWIAEQMQSSQVQREATAIASTPSIEEQLAGMQLALAQQAEMITNLQAEIARLASSNTKKRAPRAKKLSARDLAAQEDAAREAVRFQEEQAAARRREAQEIAAPEEAERLAAAEEAANEFFAKLNRLGKDEAGEVEPADNVPELDLEAELEAWAADEAKRTSAPLNRGNRGFDVLLNN